MLPELCLQILPKKKTIPPSFSCFYKLIPDFYLNSSRILHGFFFQESFLSSFYHCSRHFFQKSPRHLLRKLFRDTSRNFDNGFSLFFSFTDCSRNSFMAFSRHSIWDASRNFPLILKNFPFDEKFSATGARGTPRLTKRLRTVSEINYKHSKCSISTHGWSFHFGSSMKSSQYS